METFTIEIRRSHREYNFLTFPKEYSKLFPSNGKEIVVVDSDKEEYKKTIHNQIENRIDGLVELYDKYNVKENDKVIITVNPHETGKIYVVFEKTDKDIAENSLSKKQILELIRIIQDLIKHIDCKKEKFEVAKYIEKPKIPAKLSESLIFHLIEDRKILKEERIANCQFGGGADIKGKSGRSKIKIEIKATTSDFQQLGEKDVKANFLIWMDLKDVFEKKENDFGTDVEIYIIEPQKHGIKKGKRSLEKLKKETEKKEPDFKRNILEYLEENNNK